jgi:hypothetical protein
MPASRPPLCHRCGSPHVHEVDDHTRRCPECGAESRVTHLVATSDPSRDRQQHEAARDRYRSIDREAALAFVGATFFPFALDERWTGLRRIGGHGGSKESVTSLVLAFGDAPWDDDAADVRVRTDLQGGAFVLARQQIDHLWRCTGVLDDRVRRAAFPVDGRRDADPTVPWDHVEVTVDGGAVEFAVLRHGRHWVAQATVGDVVIGIESRGWAVGNTGLRAETAFDRYVEGNETLRRSWPSR